jgi:predicted DCC family thiol-disulfide oxidoreductase YuxK
MEMGTPEKIQGKAIVFFDGVCGLCNSSVDFLIKRDKGRNFFYSPQQGKTIETMGLVTNIESMESIMLWKDGRIYEKSRAVAQISKHLPFPWNLGAVIKLIPSIIADPIYDFIARNRYKWFGKKESCRIPSQEERELFLD